MVFGDIYSKVPISDIDEAIVPRIDLNLVHMIERIRNAPQNTKDIEDFDGFNFAHAYFFKGHFPRQPEPDEMVPR